MAESGREIVKKAGGVIFDLDGTLIDSMGIWKEIDVSFLAEYGYEVPDDLHEAIEGMSFTETAVYFKERFSLPLSLDEIKRIWTGMAYDKYVHEISLKPGVEVFLPYLERCGCRMAIASSNSRTLIEAILGAHGIDRYFSAIVTGCDVKAGKPAPDVYLEAAKKLGIPAADCVVFEDIPAGIQAGKSAGMHVFAVEDSFSEPLKEKKLAMSDGWISDYRELIAEEKQ